MEVSFFDMQITKGGEQYVNESSTHPLMWESGSECPV